MEIVTHTNEGYVELELRGILDSSWAGPLSAAIDEAIREGTHRLLVNLSGVSYLSSAGISVLVHAHRQLVAIQGEFGVGDPSPACRQVLKLSGLERLLIKQPDKFRRRAGGTGSASHAVVRRVVSGGLQLEMHELGVLRRIPCQTFGWPEMLARSGFQASDCRPVDYPAESCGLGLGAFGADFNACRDRFGEFLAAGGAAVHLPADDRGSPDYQLALESYVPEVQALYGLRFASDFSRLIRFEPAPGVRATAISSLLDQCLALSDCDAAGLVILAEAACLIGAALKQSPAIAGTPVARDFFAHPDIRKRLSFTPEPSYPRTTVLIVGVASRGALPDNKAQLAPFLRPCDDATGLLGHFHAAVFSYRPVKQGRLELGPAVSTLFESSELQAVLHLLRDSRQALGGGESELVRGACWVGPLGEVLAEHN